jgi:hypothetical protein
VWISTSSRYWPGANPIPGGLQATVTELGILETLRCGFGDQFVEPPIPKATAITNAMEPGGEMDAENAGIAALLRVAEELLGRHMRASQVRVPEPRRHAG